MNERVKNMSFNLAKWAFAGLFISVLTACSSVQTQQLSAEKNKEIYTLVDTFLEPPGFESHSLRSESEELCPKGYDILNRHAGKSAEFGIDHAQCVSPGGCDYALQWRIQCAEKPKAPFSFFGKF